MADKRRERSRLTRERVARAARELFVDAGYLATTIEDVAAHAGVSPQTIYYGFGTKPALLAAALAVSVAGDLGPRPLLERPWVQTLREEHDPNAAVRQLVEGGLAIVARTAPIYEVIRRASADPDVAALLEENRRERYLRQRDLVAILADHGHLGPTVNITAATDAYYALVNEEIFQLLVAHRGWTTEQLRDWILRMLAPQLRAGDRPVRT